MNPSEYNFNNDSLNQQTELDQPNQLAQEPNRIPQETAGVAPGQKGVYLNGRKQVIDLLRALDPEMKNTLLKNMSMRNSQLTRDLENNSLSFSSLTDLNRKDLSRLFEMIDPTLIGLALYYTSRTFQKQVLGSISKTRATKAFGILQQDLHNKTDQINRAQEKVLQVAIELRKRRLINI
jgi:flagellar motor switch protein FliG